VLVNISSFAAHRPTRQRCFRGNQVGMNGWSEALRQELQSDIRVTVIDRRRGDRAHQPHHQRSGEGQHSEQFYAELDDAERDPAATHQPKPADKPFWCFLFLCQEWLDIHARYGFRNEARWLLHLRATSR
jgi:hypothetical protein